MELVEQVEQVYLDMKQLHMEQIMGILDYL